MANFKGFQFPVVLVKGVYTSGHVADIGPLQLGIIDNKTHYVATAAGNGTDFYIANGSGHTRDQLTKWVGGMKKPKKSEIFRGSDIRYFEKSTPSRPKNEQWIVGYDGSKASNTLAYQPGQTYWLKIRLYGQPVVKYWGNDIERIIPLYTGCLPDDSDCTQTCGDTYLGVKAQTRQWAKNINDNPDLKEFGIKAYPVFSDYGGTATTATFTGGTGTAASVTPIVNNGVVTGYTINSGGAYSVAPTTLTIAGSGTGATASFTTTGSSPNITVNSVTSTAGGTGYSPNISLYKYTLRVVDNGEAGALQTVQRYYPSTYKVTRTDYTRGVSTYSTDYIAAQPAVFQPKTFNYLPDCGACLNGDTLVPSYDLYTVRRQLASSTDLSSGTLQTNYAAQIVTDYAGVTGSGMYEGVINGEAVVSFKHTTTTDPVARLNSDVVIRSGVSQAVCVPTTPATVAWVQGTGGYVQSRTLTLTLPNEDCNNAPTVADIQSAVQSVKGIGTVTDITDNSGGGIQQDFCVKVFQVTQTSGVMADLYCMTTDNIVYADMPTYKATPWIETITPDAFDANIHAGIRIVAPFVSQQFGIDSYDVNEYYDIDPTMMEVTLWQETPISTCKFNTLVGAHKVVYPSFSRLSGNWVLQYYIARNSAYKTFEEWEADPRGREVIDNNVLSQINRSSYYVAYYFGFVSKKDDINHGQRGEAFEAVLFVDEADKATQDFLESHVQSVSGKFKVYLENRGK